jgi:hypothetical protein
MKAIDDFPGALRPLAVLVALVGMWAGRRGIVLFARASAMRTTRERHSGSSGGSAAWPWR